MRILFFILLTPLVCVADAAEDLAANEAFLEQEALEQEQNLPDPFSPEFLLPFETPAAAETLAPEQPVPVNSGTPPINAEESNARRTIPVLRQTATPAPKHSQNRRFSGQEGTLNELLGE